MRVLNDDVVRVLNLSNEAIERVAAVHSVRQHRPGKIVVAVPAAAAQTCEEFRDHSGTTGSRSRRIVASRTHTGSSRAGEEAQGRDAVSTRPVVCADVESCVEATIQRIGRRIRLGTPLGLGKANHLVNEFFRRAREDPRLELHIFTALTLARPRWTSELERRFVEPLAERLFGGYPELAYVDPLRRGHLPNNIRVTEFYFQPGSFLDSPLAQQNYMCSNYTHVVRDLMDAGINVLAQLVSKLEENGTTRYSLSCNSDKIGRAHV